MRDQVLSLGVIFFSVSCSQCELCGAKVRWPAGGGGRCVSHVNKMSKLRLSSLFQALNDVGFCVTDEESNNCELNYLLACARAATPRPRFRKVKLRVLTRLLLEQYSLSGVFLKSWAYCFYLFADLIHPWYDLQGISIVSFCLAATFETLWTAWTSASKTWKLWFGIFVCCMSRAHAIDCKQMRFAACPWTN